MNKRTILAILAVVAIIMLSGCSVNNEYTEWQQREYSVGVDYIGGNFSPSEHVTGVNVYNDRETYNPSGSNNNTVWVEEEFADKTFVNSLIESKKDVIVIATESDFALLTEKITGEKLNETADNSVDFMGLMFTRVDVEVNNEAEDVKDGEEITLVSKEITVGIYESDSALSDTDFLAFLSGYDFNGRYQGDAIETSYMGGAFITDETFNAVNFGEQAYAVICSTMADYNTNPYYVNQTDDRYEFTVMSYADVACINGKSSGFDITITAGDDSWIIKHSPDEDMMFTPNTDMYRNFLFKRYFDASLGLDYSGILMPLEKGDYGIEAMDWRIASTERIDEEIALYNSKNITVAVDCISDTGTFSPVTDIAFLTENENGVSEWRFAVNMNKTSSSVK